MTVAGGNTLTLQDILIGDVWLASGQSNMEWPIKGVRGDIDNADVEIAGANFPRIRLFRVEQKTAPKPESRAAASGWHAVTPNRVADFSAVAYLSGGNSTSAIRCRSVSSRRPGEALLRRHG